MINQAIVQIFSEIADLLEIKGDNPFRVRAYRKAAQNIEGLQKDLAFMGDEEILAIPGIGHDLAGKIHEYVSTRRIETYDQLIKEVPEGLALLLRVPGVGPKTAKLLHERLKIKSIDDLEKLSREHKLAGLPGIKLKTEENIIRGIEMLKRGKERFPIGRALPLALEIIELIKAKSPVQKTELAGSLRRWKDTVKDIDILATSKNPALVMKTFIRLPMVEQVMMQGPTKSSVMVTGGIQVDLRVVDSESFGAALAYFTGSKEHNIRLREMAVRSGLKINEYGIFREEDGKRLGGYKEADVYRLLGLSYIPPELREDRGEIEAAIQGTLPELIQIEDIRGDLHVHSDRSDGGHTIEEIAKEARARGYEYIAITDHTKGLGIARGLNEERLLNEVKEIAALNRKLRGFRVLSGAEVDIRSDNRLDLPDEILRKLDIVVASVHSGFRQGRQQMTRRLLSAIANPFVSVIAHPTGRLLGERDAYDVDMEQVFRAARENGTALEINAYPLRLDLNDIFVKQAREFGVTFAISTDTHVTPQFDYMQYGVSIARRGWLGKSDVINTRDTANLLKWLRKKGGEAREK